MNRHCRFHLYKTNATYHLSYPFLCSSKLLYFIQHMWIKYGHDKMHENHKNLNFCRFAGFESTAGSAHNIVQFVTGQRTEAWVDHRVGAWSFQFPTGQRTPTYGLRILMCFSVCPKLQAMRRRIDLLWSTVRAQIQFLSISHSVWKAVKWVGWFVTINRSLVTCIN